MRAVAVEVSRETILSTICYVTMCNHFYTMQVTNLNKNFGSNNNNNNNLYNSKEKIYLLHTLKTLSMDLMIILIDLRQCSRKGTSRGF